MIPFFIIVSLDAACGGLILPLLPFYSIGLGATPFLLGLLLSVEALSQFCMAPWIGRLSDRYGRKPILMGSQCGALISFILLACADNILFLFLARILFGLTAGNLATAAAYAADHSSASNRRQAIGIFSAAIGLGMMTGSAISGMLVDISITLPIWVAAVLSFISIMTTRLFLLGGKAINNVVISETKLQNKMSLRALLALPVIRVILTILLLHYLSYGMFASQLAVFLSERFSWEGHAFGAKELGFIFTLDGALNIMVQLFLMKKLSQFFSEKYLIVFIFSLLAIGYFTTGMTHHLGILALGLLLISVGAALARPSFVSAFSLHIPQQQQGMVMGIILSLVSLTDITAPVIAGFILHQGWLSVWVMVITAMAILGMIVTLTRLKTQNQ